MYYRYLFLKFHKKIHLLQIVIVKHFVDLKSNSALFYNKGHNLLTSAFPQKNSPKLNMNGKIQVQ